MRSALILALALLACTPLAHAASGDPPLPIIGPAPGFALISQDNAAVTLESFRGKVVAVAFIFTSCPDVCPLLTAKMAQVQDELGTNFGAKIAFISITVDPEHDTPDVLKLYAQTYGANLAGWTFLTGAPKVIADVVHGYGGFAKASATGGVDHALLTSIVDSNGNLRVQYLGVRFDPEEFRRDLLSLLNSP